MLKHPIILFTIFMLLLLALPANTHAEDKAPEEIGLLLEVDVDRIINDIVDEFFNVFRKEARKAKMPYSRLKKIPDGMSIHLRQITDQDKVIEIISDFDSQLEIVSNATSEIIEVRITEYSKNQIIEHAVRQTIETILYRANKANMHKLTVQRQSPDGVIIEFAGIEASEKLHELFSRGAARLSFRMVEDTGDGRGTSLSMADAPSQTMVISRRAIILSHHITDIQPSLHNGKPVVAFSLSSVGAKRFCDVTRGKVGKYFAIVRDNQIVATSRIETKACDGNGIITGNFSEEEANNLAVLLRTSRLLAPLKVPEGYTSNILDEAKTNRPIH